MSFILERTITETFLKRIHATPNLVGFEFKSAGILRSFTFEGFYDQCREVSHGFIAIGARHGDRIAILSNTRFEWSLCDMAILGAKAVTVPIYPSLTATDVSYLLSDSGAKIVIAENQTQARKIPRSFYAGGTVVTMEAPGGDKQILTLDELRQRGRAELAKNPGHFDSNLLSADPSDLITICYTSGTTGVPKGVMLTHDNMMSVLEDCVGALSNFVRADREVLLSFLPFSHILGKVESMAGYVFGWKQAFAEKPERIMPDLARFKPTILFAVPRIFEKAYGLILSEVESFPPWKRKLFGHCVSLGQKYYASIWQGRIPSFKDKARYAFAAAVFNKIRRRFGGRLRFCVCGGAPLSREIGEFMHVVGIQIFEGYGLTETCAPVTLNTPDHLKFGSVGRPLPEVSLKIAEDGEILVKSRKVFKGYFNMPKETDAVMTDGWFKTGDIGYIDGQGYLHVTDRKKDIIVTSGGKNIAPQKIEAMVKPYKLISQFVVHGDRRNYLTALVTLESEQVLKLASDEHILFSEYSELIKNPKIISAVQRIIDEVNGNLASFETIKKFAILPEDLTIERGELTPSLKVKRAVVNERYRAICDSMYA